MMSEKCWLELVLSILAVYRASQLIALDVGPYEVLTKFRAELGRRASRNATWKSLAELVYCPYCVGVWLALFLTICLRPCLPLVWWLAVAGGQAVLEELRRDAE